MQESSLETQAPSKKNVLKAGVIAALALMAVVVAGVVIGVLWLVCRAPRSRGGAGDSGEQFMTDGSSTEQPSADIIKDLEAAVAPADARKI
jgi:hypothetical protein